MGATVMFKNLPAQFLSDAASWHRTVANILWHGGRELSDWAPNTL